MCTEKEQMAKTSSQNAAACDPPSVQRTAQRRALAHRSGLMRPFSLMASRARGASAGREVKRLHDEADTSK